MSKATFDLVRIIPRGSDFLNRRVGSRGEIFYDQNTNSLRLYDGNLLAGYSLARSDLQNVSNIAFFEKAQAAGISTSGGGGGETTVTVSSTVPSSPANGNLWLNTNNGRLYVYINDGDSSQWIQPATPTPADPDLTDYATKIYVDVAVANVSVDLTGYATEIYVQGYVSNYVNTTQYNFSVAADDSTQKLISSGESIKFIGANGITTSSDAEGNITITGGSQVGDLTITGTSVDSNDSSEISFVPAVRFNSDITVENELFVSNRILAGSIETTAIGIPEFYSETNLNLSAVNSINFYADKVNTYGAGITAEVVSPIIGANGVVDHNVSNSAVFFHASLAGNFTVNFTNVPTTTNRSITIALILSQGGTARVPIAAQIDGVSTIISWLGAGGTPSGNNNQIDVVSFTLIRTGIIWTILGSLSTYG